MANGRSHPASGRFIVRLPILRVLFYTLERHYQLGSRGVMVVSQAQTLQTAREMLTGEPPRELTRNDLPGLSTKEQVHIAVAIMLAHHQEYLRWSGMRWYVRGSISGRLNQLLVYGVPHQKEPRSNKMLVACKAARLYSSGSARPGYNKPVWLTPPPELLMLVEEYGQHEAAVKFFQETQEALRMRRRSGRQSPTT